MARIVCGPIIGRISANSVNLMLETDIDIENVVCTVMDQHTMEVAELQLSCKALVPKVWTINGLQADRKYSIICNELENFIDVSFHTIKENPSRLEFIGLSAWDEGLAKHMLQHIDGTDAVLHLGNTVATHRFVTDFINTLDKSLSLEETNVIFEQKLRQQYRRCLTQTPSFRKLLASCQNLFIWGVEESITWPYAETYQVQITELWQIATRVYRQYLRAVWDDDMTEELGNKPRECYKLQWGHIVLFMTDVYGNRLRNWKLDRNAGFLNNTQVAMLKSLVDEKHRTDAIIFASPLPFIGMTPEQCLADRLGVLDSWPCLEIDFYKIFLFSQKWGGCTSFIAGGTECGITTLIEYVTEHESSKTTKRKTSQVVAARLDEKWTPVSYSKVANYQNWSFAHNEFTDHAWANVVIEYKNGLFHTHAKLVTLPTEMGMLQPIQAARIVADLTDDYQLPVLSSTVSDVPLEFIDEGHIPSGPDRIPASYDPSEWHDLATDDDGAADIKDVEDSKFDMDNEMRQLVKLVRKEFVSKAPEIDDNIPERSKLALNNMPIDTSLARRAEITYVEPKNKITVRRERLILAK
jgi:hypothetical protein